MTEISQTDPILCARCGETSPGVENPSFPGPVGAELRARTCRKCWAEWLNLEVMVINELQLNFMDPKSLDILAGQMREFLCLDTAADPDE
jgi:Fe-S cluster biosynthesis and repair protein YggX